MSTQPIAKHGPEDVQSAGDSMSIWIPTKVFCRFGAVFDYEGRSLLAWI